MNRVNLHLKNDNISFQSIENIIYKTFKSRSVWSRAGAARRVSAAAPPATQSARHSPALTRTD